MLLGQPIRQIAYFVPDMREAARRHSGLFGSGPFFVMDSMPLSKCIYRGTERPLDHGACVGQWGDIMIEFNQQNAPGPSYFHDLYPEGSGRYGFHHVGIIVDDVEDAVQQFSEDGLEVTFSAESYGIPILFIDAIERYGHFIEIYPDAVSGIYDVVKAASGRFDEGLFRNFPIPSR